MVPLPLSSSRLRTRHPFDNNDEADKPTFAMCRRGQPCRAFWILDPSSYNALLCQPKYSACSHAVRPPLRELEIAWIVAHTPQAKAHRALSQTLESALPRHSQDAHRQLEREQRLEQILSVCEGCGQLPRAAASS